MIETVEEFGNRWRDRALEAELEVERLKAQLAAQTTTEGRADQAALRERYATAIHDAMEPDLSLVDQEPAYQALIARAAEAAIALATADRAAVFCEAADALGRMDYDTDSNDYGYDNYRDAWNGGVMDGSALLRRMAGEMATPETHTCDNCEGVAPDTCFNNPHRPPEQCPRSEFEDYGQKCQKPAGHNLCTFEEQPSVQSCGDAKRHPSHAFLRMEVLFQCPGIETADNGTES